MDNSYKMIKTLDNLLIKKGEEKFIFADTICDRKIVIGEGAKLTYVLFLNRSFESFGQSSERKKIEFELSGRNCEVNFYGFIIGRGNDNFNFETVAHCLAEQTKAHFVLKGALFDDSIVDYKGNLIVEKEAQLSDTYLAHHTLLLSEKSRARTIPCLEIEADNVKSGHAATIGKVDSELLFYFKSRGIDEKSAERLLVEGFFESHVQNINNENICSNLRKLIQDSIPHNV